MKKKTKTKTETNKNNNKKTCSTTRLSQGVYKRDFCRHVFANPDRYIYISVWIRRYIYIYIDSAAFVTICVYIYIYIDSAAFVTICLYIYKQMVTKAAESIYIYIYTQMVTKAAESIYIYIYRLIQTDIYIYLSGFAKTCLQKSLLYTP